MGKKITLTSDTNRPIDFDIDTIERVDVEHEVTFVFTKDKFAFPVKESKSRTLINLSSALYLIRPI